MLREYRKFKEVSIMRDYKILAKDYLKQLE